MKITKSELKEMIREALREELSTKNIINESAETAQGFNIGDEIIAKNDVYYGPAFDVFEDEYAIIISGSIISFAGRLNINAIRIVPSRPIISPNA